MRRALALLAVLAAAPALTAQQQTVEVFLYGGTPLTTNWEIRRCTDLDGDDLFLTPGEAIQFAFDNATMVTYVDNMRYGEVNGRPAMYGPGGNDVILRMTDDNGDGDALDPGEVTVFVDTRAVYGVTNTSPDDLDFEPGTWALYVTDDNWNFGPQLGAGITRYEDLNGDGDAMDPGEATLFVDGQGTQTVMGLGGTPVTIGLTDFEAIMIDSNGVVIGFEQQDRMLYAFQDLNGDGDAMDPGEAWNFCNLVDDVPGLEVNADIVSGALLPPRCPSTSGTGWYASLEALSVDRGAGPNGEDLYWIGSTASPTSCSGAQALIYRGIDLNADGDLNDAGEVVLWLNGPNNGMLYPVTRLYDAVGHDGGVSIFQENGPPGPIYTQDSVWFLTDLNGNGNAEDFGEQIMTYAWDPDGCYAVSLGVAPEGQIGPAQPWFEVFGTAGTTSIGTNPAIGYNGLPGIGQAFDVSLTGGIPLGNAVLILGFSDTQYQQFNLPLDLTFYGMPGNTLYCSVDMQFPTGLNGSGSAQLSFNVPPNPSLDGTRIHFQWYVVDANANQRGAVMSDALRGEIH